LAIVLTRACAGFQNHRVHVSKFYTAPISTSQPVLVVAIDGTGCYPRFVVTYIVMGVRLFSIHTHTHTYTHIHTYTHTHTYIHTYTHTHTYIHTYTHTHSQPGPWRYQSFVRSFFVGLCAKTTTNHQIS